MGIDVNAQNEREWTPFHIVCKKGYFKIAEMMMKYSVELNIDLNAKGICNRLPILMVDVNYILTNFHLNENLCNLIKYSSNHCQSRINFLLRKGIYYVVLHFVYLSDLLGFTS